jgi:oligopeptide/dipeptide ABC transporter ATP-binding protein
MLDHAQIVRHVQIREAVFLLQEEYGLAYLFVSHDLGVVEHIGHRIAVMYLGRIVELASRDDLFADPQHPYSEALIAAAPIPDPRAKRERKTIEGEVPSPMNPPSGCHFHTRCPYAVDRCRKEAPPLREIAPGRHVACHLRGPQ